MYLYQLRPSPLAVLQVFTTLFPCFRVAEQRPFVTPNIVVADTSERFAFPATIPTPTVRHRAALAAARQLLPRTAATNRFQLNNYHRHAQASIVQLPCEDIKMPSTTSKPTSASPTRPNGWSSEHEDFVRRCVRNGEDPESVRILFETEYPKLVVERAWIMKRCRELA